MTCCRPCTHHVFIPPWWMFFPNTTRGGASTTYKLGYSTFRGEQPKTVDGTISQGKSIADQCHYGARDPAAGEGRREKSQLKSLGTRIAQNHRNFSPSLPQTAHAWQNSATHGVARLEPGVTDERKKSDGVWCYGAHVS